jgi:hypothetical protein
MVADIFRRQGKSSGGTTRQQITTNALRVGAPRSLSTERVGASPFRSRSDRSLKFFMDVASDFE